MIRDGWSRDSAYAMFDCGPHGVMNAGHAHADVLALVATVGGRDLLVDSGTFSYPGPERNAFRGGGAHNALLVDGEGSSVPADGAFQWRHVAHGRLLEWVDHPRFTFVEGTHDGFARLPEPATHRRAVLFLPGIGWVVRDQIISTGTHSIRTPWHLAPGLVAHVAAPNAAEPALSAAVVADAAGADAAIALYVAVFGTRGATGALVTEPTWVSPRYGAREPATRLVFEQRGTGAQEIVTFLLPSLGREHPCSVRELACEGDARAFMIQHSTSATDGMDGERDPRGTQPDRCGVLVIGCGTAWQVRDAPSTSGDGAGVAGPWLEGDTEWAWLVVTSVADAAAAGRGSYLRHQGRTILPREADGHGPASAWVAAVRRGTEWLDDGPALGTAAVVH